MRILITIFLFLFLSLLISLEKLQASDGYVEYAVEAEWIFFRPSVNSILVQQSLAGPPLTAGISSTNKVSAFDFASGWRAGFNWESCNQCSGINFRWTQLHTDNHATYLGSDATPLDFAGGIAITEPLTERKRFSYHALEGLYYHNVCHCNCFNLEILAGAQYAWLVKRDRYTGATTLYKQNSHTWGVGPEAGLDLKWNVWGPFALVGRGTCALLASRQHASSIINISGISSFPAGGAATDPLWSVIPTFDLRFGISYMATFCYFNFYVEAGYEALIYNNALVGANQGTFAQDAADATMQGPYISARIPF